MNAPSSETKASVSADNIVQFPSKTPEPPPQPTSPPIWTCGDCGCMTFFLRADMTTECAHCHKLGSDAQDGAWRRRLPDVPADVPEVEASYNIVADLGSPVFAQRAWFKRVTAPDADLVVLASLMRDGTISMWGEAPETDEQREWFSTRMDRLKAMVMDEERVK